MAFIQLNIEEPEHDASFVRAPVRIGFRGTVGPLPEEVEDTPLYYRWYSSSVARLSKDGQGKPIVVGYSMNEPALTNLDTPFEYDLEMGSHVITFAVSDRSGETDEDFNAIQHGGVTGGRSGDHPCTIHVFKANIISPSSNVSVSNRGLVLTAEAPAAWGDMPPEPYHDINRLAYRWRFEPQGDPPGRPMFETNKLGRNELTFSSANSNMPPTVTYSLTLPSTLTTKYEGRYRITLSVADKNSPEIFQGVTASIDITLE